MDFNNYGFDQSSYERPNCKYHCGRSRLWQHSCWQGPNASGECGGTSECKPTKVGDRYQCTRPSHSGGPCGQGPHQDGRCCQQRSPCIPKRSLRTWRGHISLLVLLFIIALIEAFSGFSGFSDSEGRPYAAMSDAGPLSAAHANQKCGSCHQAHEKKGFAWLTSAFSDHDLTDGCLSCHRFEGNARSAHQSEYPDHEPEVTELQCISCHSEHAGQNTDIKQAAAATCSNCHEAALHLTREITDFVGSHPDFSGNYPYEIPQSIYFDHKRHVGEYFVEDKWTSKPNRDAEFAALAAEACTTCHESAGATRAVTPKTFEAMCSSCHQQQIHDRPLIVMTLEEPMPILIALAEATENELDDEELAPGTIKQMKDYSLEPLMNMTGDASADLWAGLSPVEVKVAAEAWAQEEDVELPMPEMQQEAGWHTGENDDGDQSLFYRASTHTDPLIRAWIENFVSRVKSSSDEKLRGSMAEALDSLLDAKEGAGACGKCHASGIRNALLEGSKGKTLWGYQTQETKIHTPFAHGPHINLSCDSCHQFAKDVDFARYFKNQDTKPSEFKSAFIPIEKQMCSECHNPKLISDNCLTCHVYHGKMQDPSGFMQKHVILGRAKPTTEVTAP